MSTSPELSAAAASDAYIDRSQSDVEKLKPVFLNGQNYQVFGYKDDARTGFHATAYQDVATGEIIIAYRGTDLDIKHHARTALQDLAVDATMVKARINPQKEAADAFTQEILDKAQKHGISKDHVTVTGHSLGGTLAQIEASKFGLHGATFNAYGAVDLGYALREGGHQVINYVMAGDVVSAASHHYGQTIVLASVEDIASLQAGRYLNTAPGAPAPNPLLAMRLSDHSLSHFTGEGGVLNVLAPDYFAEHQTRYESHRAAIDSYRNDMYRERTELTAALNHPASRNIETTLANLSPRGRQHVAEYYAAHFDAPLHQAVAHNRVVHGVEHGLDQAAVAMRRGGQNAQYGAEQLAQKVQATGLAAQEQAAAVSRGAQVFMPINPLAATGAALGASAAGYVMKAQADGVARAGRLTGRAADLGSEWVAGQTEEAGRSVGQGAHLGARLATQVVHAQEAMVVNTADRIIDTYQTSRATGKAWRDAAAQAYDATRQAVSRGIEAIEHATGHAGGAPTGSAPALNETRHPHNPDHALYNELQRRIPEASESRLMQFTAACHTNKITADNLSTIHLDEATMRIGFRGSSFLAGPISVDLNTPPPLPVQAIRDIQQYDQQQTQMISQMHVQNAQMSQQTIQAPTPGGP
ncbi:MAG: Mbeg1-like protein [Rhodanobacter sp.]